MKNKIGILVSVIIFLTFNSTFAETAEENANLIKAVQLSFGSISNGKKITENDYGLFCFDIYIAPKIANTNRPPNCPEIKNQLRITVNGENWTYDFIDNGPKTGGKFCNYYYRIIGVRLGTPGQKTIQAILGPLKSDKVTIDYEPEAKLKLSEIFEGQAFFGRENIDIKWKGCYLKKETIKATINGKEIKYEIDAPKWPELLEGKIIAGTALSLGINEINIEGLDYKGGEHAAEVRFFYYPDNIIPLGDYFILKLGPNNKTGMGPVLESAHLKDKRMWTAYWAQVEGDGLLLRNKQSYENNFTWAHFEAVKEGKATITIMEQSMVGPHPGDQPKEVKRFDIKVKPVAGLQNILQPFVSNEHLKPGYLNDYPDNIVPLGNNFSVELGPVSIEGLGPFYSVKIEGESLFHKSNTFLSDGKDEICIAHFEAVKEGKATIRIMKQSSVYDKVKEIKRFEVIVKNMVH